MKFGYRVLSDREVNCRGKNESEAHHSTTQGAKTDRLCGNDKLGDVYVCALVIYIEVILDRCDLSLPVGPSQVLPAFFPI